MITSDQNRVIGLNDGIKAWTDTDTGLTWEIKNGANVAFMYTWRKGALDKVADTAISYMEADVKDCQSYIDRMNAEKYAGYSDWRMPSIAELKTLLRDESGETLVKTPPSHNVMSGVWSDTPRVAVNVLNLPSDFWRSTAAVDGIYIIDFRSMSVGIYDHEFALWVRAVRGVSTSDT